MFHVEQRKQNLLSKLDFNFSETSVLTCKDHMVSGEVFELHREEQFDFLATFPRPDLNELPEYYKSEEYISHTDRRSTPTEILYQWVKRYMLVRKLRWLEFFQPGKGNLLDFGAGTGDFLVEARKRGWSISGVEPHSEAKKLALKKDVLLRSDSKKFPSASFQVISLWHVLEHVPDLEFQIEELDRLLAPDGLLVIALPNFQSYDAQKYGAEWAAYDVPRHLYHFSIPSIEQIFSKIGFNLVATRPLIFDAYYVSLLSEKNRKGFSNLVRAFWIGTLSNIKARKTGQYSSVVYFLRKK